LGKKRNVASKLPGAKITFRQLPEGNTTLVVAIRLKEDAFARDTLRKEEGITDTHGEALLTFARGSSKCLCPQMESIFSYLTKRNKKGGKLEKEKFGGGKFWLRTRASL